MKRSVEMKLPMKWISALSIAVCAWGVLGVQTDAEAQSAKPKCIKVRGELIENSFREGCKPGHSSCFRGVLTAQHGLRATTYFKGDPGAVPGPPTSPGSRAYSGVFEYTTERGTLEMRETGVNVVEGNPPERVAVTAYQKITNATGDLTGATGHIFVSGFVTDNPDGSSHVDTEVTGEVCLP